MTTAFLIIIACLGALIATVKLIEWFAGKDADDVAQGMFGRNGE